MHIPFIECNKTKLADIVFIVDESGSIGTNNFQRVRSFLYSIVSGLDVSLSTVRVGIVTYSDKAEAQVYLNSFDNQRDLLNFIRILPYRGGGTNTGAALKFTREEIFTKEHGSRNKTGFQQVAVVITDGESQDNVSTAAADLRRAGVTVYALGIKNANQKELNEIASYPAHKHVFNVDSFEKLKALEQTLQKSLCHNIWRQTVTINTRRTGIQKGLNQWFSIFSLSQSTIHTVKYILSLISVLVQYLLHRIFVKSI